jgi:ADP-heptose:LPS heptosyltransferase
VLFGPTAVDFFGYPDNINLMASGCTGCWRTKRDWHIYCPRGLDEAECMKAFTPEMIVKTVLDLVHQPAP